MVKEEYMVKGVYMVKGEYMVLLSISNILFSLVGWLF